MDKEEIVRRGHEAARLLKSPIWTDTWDAYRVKVFSAIESAKTDEATIRGKLMLGVMNDVRQAFEALMKAGDYATAEIELEKKRKRWPFAA